MLEFTVDNQDYIFNQNNMMLEKKNEYIEADTLHESVPEISRKKYFANANLIMNNCCNMACDYCYANKGRYDVTGKVLDFETAKTIIDTLVELALENSGNSIHVTFFGGEPMLQIDLIKSIVDYTYNKIGEADIRPNFDIVTNGTILSNKVVEYLEEHYFGNTISIDVTQKVHDWSRHFLDGSGTYNLIMENVSRFRNINRVSARITINNANTDIISAVNDIRKHGITRIVFGIDNNMSQDKFNEFIVNLKLFFEDYEKAIKGQDFYLVDNITRYIVRLALRKKTTCHCSAGISYFSFSADKHVYLCHRFTGHNEGLVCDVTDDLKNIISKVATINNNKYRSCSGRSEMCENCDVFDLCGGICKYDAFNASGDIHGKNLRACTIKKQIIMSTLKLVISLSEERRKEYIMYYMKRMNEYKE